MARAMDAVRNELGGRVIAKAVFQADRMNGTERAYAEVLAERQSVGEILWFKFEPFSLRLAPQTFYIPDFALALANGEMEIHEVKGFWRDDARAKIKIAAAMFPFRFCAVVKEAKKRGGGWGHEWF